MIILSLILLTIVVVGPIFGAYLIVKAVKETARQTKIAKEANKEVKQKTKVAKEKKVKVDKKKKVKLTKEEKMKIKHEANRIAHENNPKTITLKRFEEEFGHEYMAKNTKNAYRKAQRYQEIKREVKAELKAKQKEAKNK